MKTRKHISVVYQNRKIKSFYSFSTIFSNNIFLITEDGYTACISKLEYTFLNLNIKSKKILSSNWINCFFSPSELEDEIKIQPTFFLIELTNNCNLRCKYCFRGKHINKSITYEKLDNILASISNYVLKNKILNFSIQPWGGEPMLEIDKIIHIREYFDNIDLHPTITCETNGVLLTKDNAKRFILNDIDFGISVDGVPEIHNFNRPLSNLNPSSNIIFTNINNFYNEYPNYKLSGITTNTADSISRIKDNLYFLVEQLHFKNLKMNFVKNNPYISNEIDTFSPTQLSKFYKELYKNVKNISKKYKDISEGNISVRIQNLLYRSSNDICNSHGCRGGRKMFAFDIDGNIYNCELIGDETQFLGTYKDDFISIIEKSIKTNGYFKEKRNDECKNCPYEYFCMGGCSSICLYEKTNTDSLTCAINKTIYPLIIKDIISKSFFINLNRRRKH